VSPAVSLTIATIWLQRLRVDFEGRGARLRCFKWQNWQASPLLQPVFVCANKQGLHFPASWRSRTEPLWSGTIFHSGAKGVKGGEGYDTKVGAQNTGTRTGHGCCGAAAAVTEAAPREWLCQTGAASAAVTGGVSSEGGGCWSRAGEGGNQSEPSDSQPERHVEAKLSAPLGGTEGADDAPSD